MGLEDEKTGVLPPHPHPQTYRMFLYATARWLEEEERDRLRILVEAQGASLTQF